MGSRLRGNDGLAAAFSQPGEVQLAREIEVVVLALGNRLEQALLDQLVEHVKHLGLGMESQSAAHVVRMDLGFAECPQHAPVLKRKARVLALPGELAGYGALIQLGHGPMVRLLPAACYRFTSFLTPQVVNFLFL